MKSKKTAIQEFWKNSPSVKYEKIMDFARETQISFIKEIYMKPFEIFSCRNIPLYVMELEEVTTVYLLTSSASDWVKSNLDYNTKDQIVILSEEFMYKFDMVRVIPALGFKPLDSFIRIMLKQFPQNAKLYSIEEELYGDIH